MKCDVCGGELVDALVTYTVELDGNIHVFEHVPASVCRQCGERYFSAETSEKIQDAVRNGRKPDRLVETPVIDYKSIA